MRNLIIVIVLVMILGVTGFLFQDQTKTPKTEVPKQEELSSKIKLGQAKECSGHLTPSQTEGSYYKVGSPERKNIVEGVGGEKLVVTGFVFDKDCKPIAGAWLDFWHADSNGVYDNTGYKLRGHQYSSEKGMFRLETIVPARYGSRPPHIHVKIRASENSQIITSQLYFPGESQNQTDLIFNETLIMQIENTQSGKIGKFNFVVNR